MKRSCLPFFCLILFGIAPDRLFSQSIPKIQVGTIAALTFESGADEESPLTTNDGAATFLSEWVLLMGTDIGETLSLYAEIQTVNGLSFVNYGLSAIYRPKLHGYLNFELGKFLVPFGTFLARRWASEDPFIGFPLIYEYRTGLSAFDLPNTRDELLAVRGQGHSFQYHAEGPASLAKTSYLFSGHLPRRGSGLRIISREAYLTGVQLFGSFGPLVYHLGVTNGTLSNPADINNSTEVNLVSRLAYTPLIGLTLGASLSSGSYLDKEAAQEPLRELGQSVTDFRQNALGVDLSYSIGHMVFFSELVLNRWQTPFIDEDLDALALYLEARYSFLTRFFVAGRFSELNFAEIGDPADIDGDGRLQESWDYDMRQLEVSLGYRVNRNALLKIVGQFNRSLDVPFGDPSDDLLAFQSVVFF